MHISPRPLEIIPASQGLFDSLDERAREALHAQLQSRVLPAGAVLCRAGDRSDSLYLVERGLRTCSTATPQLCSGGNGRVMSWARSRCSLASRVRQRCPRRCPAPCPRRSWPLLPATPVLLANLAGIVSRRLAARTRPSRC